MDLMDDCGLREKYNNLKDIEVREVKQSESYSGLRQKFFHGQKVYIKKWI